MTDRGVSQRSSERGREEVALGVRSAEPRGQSHPRKLLRAAINEGLRSAHVESHCGPG